MLEAIGVSVDLGGRTILADVSFAASPGQLTAIVGPNGSGKTTLMRVLAGDLRTRGAVRLNGHDLQELKPWQAAERRAVLTQAAMLAFPFTVREVVTLGFKEASAEDLAEVVDRSLARVDLAGFAGRSYQRLSGGEQQRVQLARALCQVWKPFAKGEPRWLLLDEPVSSLDIRHQIAVMQIARRFARDGGGVVTILHDLNLAARFADQVAAMKDGRVAAFGPPEQVITDRLLTTVFLCDLKVGELPTPGTPFVLPQADGAAA